MRIFATSDIHGNKALVYLISQIVKEENIDALIIAGDITPKGFYKFYKDGLRNNIISGFAIRNKDYILEGSEGQMKMKLDLLGFVEMPNYYDLSDIIAKQKEHLKQICELLKTAGIPVFMLIGNDDHIPDKDWEDILNSYKIKNLNLKSHVFQNFKIVGFQYVLPTPWNTNNELMEKDLAKKLEVIEDEIDGETIFVTHCPPKNILDKLTNGINAGSESVYNLVKNKQPLYHIFGHIHESFGSIELGKTICCNVSSLWNDWALSGFVLDTKKKCVKEIRRDLGIKDLDNMCNNTSERYLSGW